MELLSSDRSRVALAVAMIIGGCCANVLCVETLVREDKTAGTTMTFCSFVFLTLEGLGRHMEPPTSKRFPLLKPTRVPLRYYALLTLIFGALSVINNFVFAFRITMPIHTVVRSSSLVVSLLLGLLFFGKRYAQHQIIGVITLTVGITMALWADVVERADAGSSCTACGGDAGASTERGWAVMLAESFDPITGWFIGVALLVVALVLSAILGHLQRLSYERFTAPGEKPPAQEGMFYSHMLALPLFAAFHEEIRYHLALWVYSEPYPFLPGVPRLVLVAAATTLTQYVCIRGVYSLTALTSTLTCTLTITVRKFVSLVLSVVLFNNPFSLTHWTGALLVFAGVITYSGALQRTPAEGGDAAKEKRE